MSDTSLLAATALLLAPLLPLVFGMALLPRGWRAPVIRIAPWATLPAVAVVAFPPAPLDLPWLLLGVRLGLDETGRVFLFFTTALWLLAAVYARHYLAGDPRRTRFFAFYLLTMSGNLGIIVAQDVLSFYLFFALMSFSAYGLIVHNRDAAALRAGRVYIALAVLGEVLLFAGLVAGTWSAATLSLPDFAAGAKSDLVIALLLVGFGIKAGALPLHVWLPLAYSAAPTPASAVLSGAMINAGLLGWLRFLPLGQAALPEWSVLLVAAGIGAALYGVLIGLVQVEPKSVLAYSSISQMGLMTLAVGVAAAAPASWPLCLSVILIYAFHHALAKGALFLGAGVATAGIGGTKERRLVIAGLLIPALALAGLPFTSGVVAKLGLKTLTEILPVPWSGLMTAGLSLLAVGTTLLMARFLYLIWPHASVRPARVEGLIPPWTVLLFLLVFFIGLLPSAKNLAMRSLSVAEFWHAVWPIGIGASGAWAAWVLSRRAAIRPAARIPPGDILHLAIWFTDRLGRARSFVADRYRENAATRHSFLHRTIAGLKVFDVDRQLEIEFGRWITGGMAFLVVLVFLMVALAAE